MRMLWFILCVVSLFWGWSLGAQRSGNAMGCLWAVVLFLLFPISPIVVLLFWLFGENRDSQSY